MKQLQSVRPLMHSGMLVRCQHFVCKCYRGKEKKKKQGGFSSAGLTRTPAYLKPRLITRLVAATCVQAAPAVT